MPKSGLKVPGGNVELDFSVQLRPKLNNYLGPSLVTSWSFNKSFIFNPLLNLAKNKINNFQCIFTIFIKTLKN